MSLFERYKAGEHAAVYEELVAAPPGAEGGDAVAREMMKRVRANLETLVRRWRELGFTLYDPLGKPGESRADVKRFEDAWGPLPVTLRALYHEVGHINLVEDPPEDRWPEPEHVDAIAIEGIDRAMELSEEDGELSENGRLVLFLDNLLKIGYGGIGAIYIELGPAFDPLLCFEDGSLRDPETEKPMRLVPYLRQTILQRGGMGIAGAPIDELDTSLLRELTTGLIAF
ncbi:MAG: hypothetical protein JWM74_4732 [Myxococcaceae bacterium]|nr:hypothetical protein [Myxococcaceae bacterium]